MFNKENNKNNEITLLSKKHINGQYKLDLFDKIGYKCDFSDFSIILGADLWDWSLSDIENDKIVYGVNIKYNVLSNDILTFRSVLSPSIRPVMQNFNHSIISKRKTYENGVSVVEYGEYPQDAVNKGLEEILEKKFMEGELKKTGKTYTINSVKILDDKDFKPLIIDEFKYQGEKYVRVKYNHMYDRDYKLTNGEITNNNHYYWIHVSPIKWYFDEKTKLLLSKTILFSGVRFYNEKQDYNKFKETEIYKFLNKYFANDILPQKINENKTCKLLDDEKIEKLIRIIESYNQKYGYKSTINKFQQCVLALNNDRLSFFFAKTIEGANIKAHGKIVQKYGSPELNYEFARDVKGADIKAHGKIVQKYGTAELNYEFARNISGADIKSHGVVVREIGNDKINYKFARDIDGADIQSHAKTIIDSKNPKYNYKLAKYLIASIQHNTETLLYKKSKIKNLNIFSFFKKIKLKKEINSITKQIESYKYLIKKCANTVIHSKNPIYNYYFARKIEGADVKAHEQAVIDSRNLQYNYEFARDISEADIKSHGKVVIYHGNPKYNYYFARDVKGANIRAHGQKVIDSGDSEYNYYFARDVKGADVRAHGKVVIDDGFLELNYKFARDVKGADVRAHGKVVIDDNFPELNYEFSRDVKGANVRAHGQAVIDSGDSEYNYYFARDIKGANIEAHGQAVIDSGNLKYNYYFARDIKGANIEAHRQVVINRGDPELNYEFARDVKGAKKKAHARVVINSRDPELNYKFARDVKGVNPIAHGQVVIDSGNIEYNNKFLRDIKGANKKGHKYVLRKYNKSALVFSSKRNKEKIKVKK